MQQVKKYLSILFLAICILYIGKQSLVVLANESDTEEVLQTCDLSDRLIQYGGWDDCISDSGIMLFALDNNEEQLEKDILTALQNEYEGLDVREYGLTYEEYIDIHVRVINENPELFYVSNFVGWTMNNEGILTNAWFYYLDFTEEDKNTYAQKIKYAKSLVSDEMTDVEKALVLHDFLAQNCAYAYREYLDGTLSSCENVYNAYGALAEGKAVCQGYAMGYRALLNAVGINNEYCRSGEMNHGWNIVEIDGEWYHVDVTWDDPVWNTEGYVRHTYFLLSDTEIQEREHYGFSVAGDESIACTSTKYDAENNWWKYVFSVIVCEDNKQYYLECIKDYKIVERTNDETVVKYQGRELTYYSYLSRQGDNLFFNDRKNLYVMNMEDFVPQIIYTHEGENEKIYGAMVYEDGYARLNISSLEEDDYIVVDVREYVLETYNMLSGIVTSFGEEDESIQIQLADDSGTIINCTEVEGNTIPYKMKDIPNGAYKLIVNKKNHVEREYLNRVYYGDVQQDVDIWLIGDVNGDGTINARDKKLIYNHMAGTSVLIDYVFLVGDVTNDGVINARDKKLIYNHIAGASSLWE